METKKGVISYENAGLGYRWIISTPDGDNREAYFIHLHQEKTLINTSPRFEGASFEYRVIFDGEKTFAELIDFPYPKRIKRPNAEDVKRWYQILTGLGEDAMQKDIEETYTDKLTNFMAQEFTVVNKDAVATYFLGTSIVFKINFDKKTVNANYNYMYPLFYIEKSEAPNDVKYKILSMLNVPNDFKFKMT